MAMSAVRHAQTNGGEGILDPFFDYGPRDLVERRLLSLFAQQLAAVRKVAAYRDRIPPELMVDPSEFGRAELERIPILEKADLRALSPDDLLKAPDGVFHMLRASGGTTGVPVPIFWTLADWTALVQAMQRFCTRLRYLRSGFRLWNGYNQAHVSGPAFDDLVRALGGSPVPRHYGASDRHAIEEIERVRADALVLTPQRGSGKGGSLEDLLSEDPRFLERLRIRALLVSSTPLRADLLEEVREQGVETIINFYGSTESPPAGISCELDPTRFHLAQGHVLVEVVDGRGRQVRSGERGRVVVSRIAAQDGANLIEAGGTQLLRYAIGDTALYLDEPCDCGRSSPRVAEIVRVTDLADKLKGGCEQWE